MTGSRRESISSQNSDQNTDKKLEKGKERQRDGSPPLKEVTSAPGAKRPDTPVHRLAERAAQLALEAKVSTTAKKNE